MHALLTVVLLVSGAPPAKANAGAEEPSSVVVLVDNATIPADSAAALSQALRREVDVSRNFRWRDPPPMSVDELVLAIGCRKIDAGCLKKMQDGLRVDSVVVLTAVKGTGSAITMSVLHRKKGKGFKSVDLGAPGPSLVTNAVKALREQLGPTKPAGLVLTSEPAGAAVTLAGVARGQTPLKLEDLPGGTHPLSVTLDGHVAHNVDVTLEPGKTTELQVTLAPVPAPVEVAQAPAPAPAPAPTETATTTAAGASGSGGLPMLVKWPLLAVGGVGTALAVAIALVGAGLLAGGGGVYTFVWAVALLGPTGGQRMISVGSPLVHPLSFGGTGVVSLGVLLLPLAALVVVGTLGGDMVLRKDS
ncbi:MAG: PEGA domain-containing protein [Myxococcota bacterium]